MSARVLWDLVEEARGNVLRLERAAITAALEEADWRVLGAARLLRPDVASCAWLAAMLLPSGRHANLGDAVRKRNASNGYTLGRPKKKR